MREHDKQTVNGSVVLKHHLQKGGAVLKAELRERFIEAAIELAASQHGNFKLSEVFAQARLSKEDFRKAFKTKRHLIEAAREFSCKQVEPNHAPHTTNRNVDDWWVERRFRILERAIASLEIQIGEAGRATPKGYPSGTVDECAAPPHCAPENLGENEKNCDSELPLIVSNTTELAHIEPASATVQKDTSTAGIRDLKFSWSITKKLPKTDSHRNIVIFLAAILFGISAGTVTSVVYADATSTSAGNSSDVVREVKVESEDLFKRAKDISPTAASKLAFAYAGGTGVKRDAEQAIRWATTAASQGDTDSQYLLASLLSNSAPANAAHWYTKAAERGNVKAMNNVAIAYLTGTGVKKDPTLAVRWLQRAANAGYRDAQVNLGILFERGEGVKRDPSISLRWYQQAAASGDLEAEKRANWLRENVTPVVTIQ